MRTTALDDIMAMYFVSISCSLFREQTGKVEEEEEKEICKL